MGRLGVSLGSAAIGAGIGSFFGQPLLGAQLGLAAGGIAGSVLFPVEGPTLVGPRLGDLQVTSSAYGTPINIGYGTVRMNGSVIWSSGIEEVQTTEESGGKGGGGGGTVTVRSFSYFASFAVMFSEGVADEVLRIYADGKIIFDRTNSSDSDTVTSPGLLFRFYPGDFLQEADPLIAADVGADICPAFRGRCYVVFERLPLANYGNRIPIITAEISYNAAQNAPFTATTVNIPPLQWNTAEQVTDFERGFIYLFRQLDPAAINRIRIADMVQDKKVLTGSAKPRTRGLFRLSGNLFAEALVGGYQVLDISTLLPVASFPSSVSTTFTPTAFGTLGGGTGRMVSVQAFGQEGLQEFAFMANGNGYIGVLRYGPGQVLTYVFSTQLDVRVHLVGLGPVAEDVGTAFALAGPAPFGATSADLTLHRVRISANAFYDPVAGLSVGVGTSEILDIAITDVDASATTWVAVGGLLYDELDQGVIFYASVNTPGGVVNRLIKVDTAMGVILWNVSTLGVPFRNAVDSRLQNGTVASVSGTSGIAIDTRTGEVLEQITFSGSGSNTAGAAYDSQRAVYITSATSSSTVGKFGFFRATGMGEPLADIVSDLEARSGLGPLDHVESSLGQTVRGFVVSRTSPSRASLDILARCFAFDLIESDYSIKAVPRGGASVVTIPQRDLAAPDGGANFLPESRLQEPELPERVNVNYLDLEGDYQPGSQFDKRITLAGRNTVGTRQEFLLDAPVVFIASEAKAIAQRLLYEFYAGRVSMTTVLPWKYLRYDPGDVVTIALDSGVNIVCRITSMEVMGGGFGILATLVTEVPTVYTVAPAADGGQGIPEQVIPSSEPTNLFVLDIPLLRDADDLGGATSRYYLAGSNFNDLSVFAGALVFRSQNLQTFEQRAQFTNRSSYGSAAVALPDVADPFSDDTTNTLTVGMQVGGDLLASVTDDDLDAGANVALLGDELIQFKTVTDNGDGTYDLDTLRRGRRGTDVFTTGHAIGDRFIILTLATVERDSVTLGLLGTQLFFKGVTRGVAIDRAATIQQALTGRDLMPYAPINAMRSDDDPSAGDITISWTRRSRLGSPTNDGLNTTVIGEASESYEVDILDGDGGAVVRTLVSSTPSVEYDAANIASDFGSAPATLYCRIFQMSAVVGRGFSYQFALEAA